MLSTSLSTSCLAAATAILWVRKCWGARGVGGGGERERHKISRKLTWRRYIWKLCVPHGIPEPLNCILLLPSHGSQARISSWLTQ